MKLLLTSGGLSNKSIINGLNDLVASPFSQLNLAFIPTAANLEPGDKWWLIEDLNICKQLGFKTVDIVDISALPKSVWQPRLEAADIIEVGGGNTFHLRYWIKESGLETILPQLLKTKVYIGVSAGTLLVTPSLILSTAEKKDVTNINEQIIETGLKFTNFCVVPHINNKYFPELTFSYIQNLASKIKYPVYAFDDQSAIKVVDDEVEVISEGEWRLFNK